MCTSLTLLSCVAGLTQLEILELYSEWLDCSLTFFSRPNLREQQGICGELNELWERSSGSFFERIADARLGLYAQTNDSFSKGRCTTVTSRKNSDKQDCNKARTLSALCLEVCLSVNGF